MQISMRKEITDTIFCSYFETLYQFEIDGMMAKTYLFYSHDIQTFIQRGTISQTRQQMDDDSSYSLIWGNVTDLQLSVGWKIQAIYYNQMSQPHCHKYMTQCVCQIRVCAVINSYVCTICKQTISTPHSPDLQYPTIVIY